MVKLTKSLYVNYILYNKFSHIGVAQFGKLKCLLVLKFIQTRISENKYIYIVNSTNTGESLSILAEITE